MIEKRALGRGLSALIPEKAVVSSEKSNDQILRLSLSEIKTNKYQPREIFNEDKLKDLISSIKEKGVVQPILVRRAGDGYELITGERRLKAVKSLGMTAIPAIVKEAGDVDMLEIALIENIQREELNPLEEAHAYKRFVDDFGYSQEKIAQVIGKDRSTIANTLRLLSLPAKIQEYISQNSITTGHAKALLSLPTDALKMRICNIVIKKSLSVRATENIIGRRLNGTGKTEKKDVELSDIETSLQQYLGTRVRIQQGKNRGRIQIEYYSADDLNRVVEIIKPTK